MTCIDRHQVRHIRQYTVMPHDRCTRTGSRESFSVYRIIQESYRIS